MSKKYLTFDIGCIECGEESAVVGLYDSKEQAEQSIKAYLTGEPNEFGTKWGRPEWGGQHSIEIFEIEETSETKEADQ